MKTLTVRNYAVGLRGTSIKEAYEYLEKRGFTLAERSEIIHQITALSDRVVAAELEAIVAAIRSTLACSVRIGDRLPNDSIFEKGVE